MLRRNPDELNHRCPVGKRIIQALCIGTGIGILRERFTSPLSNSGTHRRKLAGGANDRHHRGRRVFRGLGCNNFFRGCGLLACREETFNAQRLAEALQQVAVAWNQENQVQHQSY